MKYYINIKSTQTSTNKLEPRNLDCRNSKENNSTIETLIMSTEANIAPYLLELDHNLVQTK